MVFELQNLNFKANCICLEDPESPVANRVLVIWPNVALPTTRPGWPKLAWLKRSKNSARNSMSLFSVNLVLLITEKSVLLKVGPITTLRPRLPKRLTGTMKGEVSNHLLGEPRIAIGPFTSGRTVLLLPVKAALLITIVTGLPLCACTIAETCQPSFNWLPWNGSSYRPLTT